MVSEKSKLLKVSSFRKFLEENPNGTKLITSENLWGPLANN